MRMNATNMKSNFYGKKKWHPKKISKAWMLSAFYEFQLYLKLNDLWWKGGEVKGYVFLGNRFSILLFVQCFDIHPATICKLYL